MTHESMTSILAAMELERARQVIRDPKAHDETAVLTACAIAQLRGDEHDWAEAGDVRQEIMTAMFLRSSRPKWRPFRAALRFFGAVFAL